MLMHYERMLAELFGEEDRARAMAARLADIARTSQEAAVAERESLLAFLRGPIERHFAFEEQAIFPGLVDHALGEEVQVATQQHETVRQLTRRLAAWHEGSSDDLRELVFDISRQLLHHTNFEGDYIYPELTHEEWRELMKETVDKCGDLSPSAPAEVSHDGAVASRRPKARPPTEACCAGAFAAKSTDEVCCDGAFAPKPPAEGSVPTEPSVNS